MNPTELCLLAEKYGSDKCPQIKHEYTPFYYELLKDKKYTIKKILEMGIGFCHRGLPIGMAKWDHHIKREYHRGASLKMWRDFFPNAMVFGGDIDKRAMFTDEERIITYLCNISNRDDLYRVIGQIGGDIDLFVDDASHIIEHQAFLANTILPLLKSDVIYAIEDVGKPEELSALLKYEHYYAVESSSGEHLAVVINNPC